MSRAPSEWYRWEKDLRQNPDIDILLSIDSTSFPLGTGPKQSEIWHSGYYPLVWTNKNYKMLYLNMGHNDIDYEHRYDNYESKPDLKHAPMPDSVQSRSCSRVMGAARRFCASCFVSPSCIFSARPRLDQTPFTCPLFWPCSLEIEPRTCFAIFDNGPPQNKISQNINLRFLPGFPHHYFPSRPRASFSICAACEILHARLCP